MADRKQAPKKPAAKKAPAKPKAGVRGGRAQSRQTANVAAKKRADAAAKRAREAGALGKRQSNAQAILRDSMIIARHAQGLAWADIAKEAGITARQCQRVVDRQREQRSPLDAAPMELLEGLARGFARSIADFEAMAFAWADTNQAAALGAKKAADEARARFATLMADVGKLPSNLELFRSEMEMRRIAGEMTTFIVGVREGTHSIDEALDFFRGLAVRTVPELTAGSA